MADLGERRLIDAIKGCYDYGWEDDDAASIPAGRAYTLITADSISRSSHMPKGVGWDKIGYFFAALNLSDIAAMGGNPKYFMSALTLPRSTRVAELRSLEKGIGRCLGRYGVKVIGGDLKEGAEMCMTGIAIGTVQKDRILRRSGAKEGDLACLTGKLGRNGAAYRMWKETGNKRWGEMVLDMEPRVKEGMVISECRASCAIDLSDGLFAALWQLGKSSGKGFEIDYSRIPIDSLALKTSDRLGIRIDDMAFEFGGEYELLFTISPRRLHLLANAAVRAGFGFSVIGEVKGSAVVLRRDGKAETVRSRGYEHFRK